MEVEVTRVVADGNPRDGATPDEAIGFVLTIQWCRKAELLSVVRVRPGDAAFGDNPPGRAEPQRVPVPKIDSPVELITHEASSSPRQRLRNLVSRHAHRLARKAKSRNTRSGPCDRLGGVGCGLSIRCD